MQVTTGFAPEDPLADPAADGPKRSVRAALEPAARWLGLVYLVFSLGGNILLSWIGAAPVSTRALTGAVPTTSLKWKLILAAQFVAAAVTRPLYPQIPAMDPPCPRN